MAVTWKGFEPKPGVLRIFFLLDVLISLNINIGMHVALLKQDHRIDLRIFHACELHDKELHQLFNKLNQIFSPLKRENNLIYEDTKKFIQKFCPVIFWIFYTKRTQYKGLKRIAGFFYGILLGVGFYNFVLVDLSFTPLLCLGLGTILCILIGLGNALSIQGM
ncbi:unnamed protein product [Timema podura]|uniref:Uncharacterized protein n=1 Tax=Timema podura TaxID=61482 RepID=A0ABN7NV94_TIMPD|nr:unnamed protein product [Timema podura]